MSIVIILAICAVIGALVGSSKGRTGAGLILGLLLGIIGIIIVACLPPTDEKRIERAPRDMAIHQEAQRRMLGGGL